MIILPILATSLFAFLEVKGLNESCGWLCFASGYPAEIWGCARHTHTWCHGTSQSRGNGLYPPLFPHPLPFNPPPFTPPPPPPPPPPPSPHPISAAQGLFCKASSWNTLSVICWNSHDCPRTRTISSLGQTIGLIWNVWALKRENVVENLSQSHPRWFPRQLDD